MADDQEAANEAAEDAGVADYEGNDANDANDIIDTIASTTPPAPISDDAANTVVDDYADDEPLPDFTVNLVINDLPEGAVTDRINAILTDEYGNLITTTPWSDAVDHYTGAITQGIIDGLEGNGTDIGGKRWWGSWSWNKALFAGLIALCIIGIILAIVFMIIGKRFKKNKRSTSAGATGTSKSVAAKPGTPDPKYSAVPTNV